MIGAAAGHQLVAASLHHASPLEDENALGSDDAREPVGEDQCGPPFHEPVEGFLDHRLALGVDGGERLVQDEDGRVAQKGARDGDALALASREPDTALADHGVVALGQPHDELLRIGGAGGGLQLGRGGVGLAHAQVLLHCPMKKIRVLADHGDEPAELIESEITDVVAADQDAAPLRIVEAEEQSGHGGLARAARAHDAGALARLDLEGQTVVRGLATPRIGEGHALEGDGWREGGRVEQRRLSIVHLGLGLQDLEDAAGGGDAEHPLVQKNAQLAQGTEHLDAEHEDDEQRGQAHPPRRDSPGAQPQSDRRAHGHARIRDAAGQRIRSQDAHGAVEERVALLREHARARSALPEGLEGGEALHRVEELGAVGGVGLLAHEAVAAVLPVPDRRGDQRHQGGDEQDQRDGQIHEGDESEDHHGGERGHGKLGQVLAEVDLELLDAFHHGEDHVARS